VTYLIANSSLPESRFKAVEAGSSEVLENVDPGSDKNCRVSIILE
jgi:flagellar motor protein MotB